jgi:hypothetical protein
MSHDMRPLAAKFAGPAVTQLKKEAIQRIRAAGMLDAITTPRRLGST